MKCPNCNAEVSDNGLFCSKCGTRINREVPPQHFSQNPAQDNIRVVYTPEPSSRSSNGALYGVVGFLVAAVIGLGIWMFVRSTGSEDSTPQSLAAQQSAPVDKKEAAPPAQATAAQTAPAQSAAQPAVAPAPAPQRTYTIQGAHRMRGSISQYPITMEIYVSGTQVSGTYYYHSQGSSNRMTVDGYINGTNMVLEEYAPNGLNTGYFSGTFTGYRYSGTFMNYEKQKTRSFTITEI